MSQLQASSPNPNKSEQTRGGEGLIAESMDFHALPRRDLQALCKRNGVRANMTNAAMADALRALPTVDGIEEYVKQPVALPTPAVNAVAEEEQTEKQGSPLKEKGDLKRDASEEKVPALGVGRRGHSRRAPAASVVAPTTRRRAAAASKSEAQDVAAEAVLAPTTRRRTQSTVPLGAEEKVPRARPTSRRAAARKTGTQQEEEEEKPQGVASEVETVLALPVSDEVRDDAEEVGEATKPQNEEQDDVVEESSQEGKGVVVDTPTSVEEEPPVAEECTGKSAVQEPQVDVQQCAAPLPSQEDSPVLGLVEQEGGAPFRDGTGSGDGQLDEEMGDHHDREEMEMVPVNALQQATLTAGETTEEIGFTGDASHANAENEVAVFSELLQPVIAEANEAGKEDGFLFEEDATVDEVLHDTITSHDTILLDFSGKIGRAAAEEGAVSTDKMPQSSVAMDEDTEDDFDTDICRADEQREVVTVDNVSQVTVTDNKNVGNENVFSSGMPPAFNSAGDLGDRITSPLFADMLDNVTKSNNVIAGEPTVSEAEDVSQCMRSNSNEKSTELVAVEEENEVKDEKQNKVPLVLTNLSLRKLRGKLKETLIAHKIGRATAEEGELSLRKLRAKLKETLIAHKRKERVALARLDEHVC